jgi:hypothetical protein
MPGGGMGGMGGMDFCRAGTAGEPWCTGEILLLSPRRLAARAAAERMAELAGERVGGTIGYATRLDSKRSAATRITVLTEGIFLKRIQAIPELAGVSAVLFDEVHERSLDSDFALALALDAQAALRPDLRLLAMSATLDGARFSDLMDGAPVIASEGRSHPLDVVHLGRAAEQRIEDAMAGAIRRALARRRAACSPSCPAWPRSSGRPSGWRLPPDVDLHRLHGSLEPAEQRAAIARAGRAAQGRARHLDRGDQPDAGRRADRGRFRTGAAAALRPGGRADPAGHRAGEPGGGDPARRPRGAAGAGARLPLVGGSGDREPAALRSAGDPGGGPVALLLDCADLGRGRSARAALARSAAGRGGGRGALPAAQRWARSARTAGRRRTGGRSPRCRCRRGSRTC